MSYYIDIFLCVCRVVASIMLFFFLLFIIIIIQTVSEEDAVYLLVGTISKNDEVCYLWIEFSSNHINGVSWFVIITQASIHVYEDINVYFTIGLIQLQ